MTKTERIREWATVIDSVVGLLMSTKSLTDKQIEYARRQYVPKLRNAANGLYDAAKRMEEGSDNGKS